MKKVFGLSAIAIFTLFFMSTFNCKVVDDDDSNERDVYSLKIGAGEISPWDEFNYSACANANEFAGSNMNGNVDPYQTRGLIEGFVQELAGGEMVAMVIVMDFGNATKATDIYDFMLSENTQKILVSGIDEAVASINNSSGDGCVGFCHFDRFYCEFRVGGYTDKTESHKDVKSFVQHFQKKISDMK